MKLLPQFLTLLEGWKRAFAQSRTISAPSPTLCRRLYLRPPHSLPQHRPVGSRPAGLERRLQDLLPQPLAASGPLRPGLDRLSPALPPGSPAPGLRRYPAAQDRQENPTAFWQRHALLPPFRINLLYSLRFLQASLLFPHYPEGDFSARAFPVRFHEVPAVDKPGRRASEEAQQEYRRLQKLKNLSTQSLAVVHDLRAQFDALGAATRFLLLALDGSFCNPTFFKAPLERIALLARARKDARLCFVAPPGSRRGYAAEIFTPEQVRQDEARPWQLAKVYFGGQWREVCYKEVQGVRWRRGTGPRPWRLLVVAPLPYRVSPHARVHYRQPACPGVALRNQLAAFMCEPFQVSNALPCQWFVPDFETKFTCAAPWRPWSAE
jgi:hypothetical protein